MGHKMPKCLDPGCLRVVLSYGFPSNSLVCLGSADVSPKNFQRSKMSPQSVPVDLQSTPKSAKEGPNEGQRHPRSAIRVPIHAKKASQRSHKRAQSVRRSYPRALVRPQAPPKCLKDPPRLSLKGPKLTKTHVLKGHKAFRKTSKKP